jgi:hypothetical protein
MMVVVVVVVADMVQVREDPLPVARCGIETKPKPSFKGKTNEVKKE